jgi:ligand-binding sensor domain-containing protein
MRYRILLFVWIVKATTQVLAQQPFTKNYQTGNGLPSNYLYSVFQDSKGYIWVTTDVGVSRFDGQTFTNFNTSHGLPDNEVFSAIEDRQGRIWFATLNGNSGFYQNGQFYNEHNFPLLRQCQLKGLTLRLFEQDDGRVAYVGAFKTVLIDLDRHQVETRILENGLALAWKEDHNRIGGATKEFGFVEQQGFRPVAKGPLLIQSLNAITIGDTLMISSD